MVYPGGQKRVNTIILKKDTQSQGVGADQFEFRKNCGNVVVGFKSLLV
jgi:hypothetical protein